MRDHLKAVDTLAVATTATAELVQKDALPWSHPVTFLLSFIYCLFHNNITN